MINYRVDDLAALVARLRAADVTIVDEIAVFEYGKFVHVLDANGQQIVNVRPTPCSPGTPARPEYRPRR
jgi:hypothetical protein